MSRKEKAKNSIYYKEYCSFLHGALKNILLLRNQLTYFISSQIQRKLKNEIKRTRLDKINFSQFLIESFGNYQNYSADIEKKKLILDQANKILKHEFNLLGAHIVFKENINWHTDFKNGYIWPKGKYYLQYKQVDLLNKADVKIPRELSRAHHLILLGQAYLLTNDEKYTFEFKKQISDWIVENPLMYSINWGCTMDVAIRAANWAYALNMFMESVEINDEFINTILTSLYEHGWFIENNLERSFKFNANHYDADLGGLLILGILFSYTRRGKKWLEFSKYALFDEMRKQIQPSGMEWENSTYYNRLVLEIFAYTLFLLKRNGFQIPNDIEYRLHKMFSFLLEISFPNWNLPIFGDNDSARFLPFDITYRNDIQYLMDIAFQYYNDPVFDIKKLNNKSSELFFLLKAGREINLGPVIRLNISDIHKSKIFLDTGIVKIIHKDILILINNSSPGRYIDDPFSSGSHAHADLLSFVLLKGKQPVFIDPGSYVYTGDYKSRNRFRSTQMHNTVVIDNKSQFRINDLLLFDYGTKAQVQNLEFYETKDIIKYTGKHNAYSYIEKELTHERSFVLQKRKNQLIISDNINCCNEHEVEINYHLHPDIAIQYINGGIKLLHNQNEIINITFEKKFEGKLKVIDTEYSESYGKKVKTKAFTFQINIHGNISIQSKIHL